ncbi:MAG TPA: cation transporter, partial [Micromonospora sp.]
AVATVRARSNLSLLVGRAIPAELREEVERELTGVPEIEGVHTLLTMRLGPDEILVAAKVDLVDEADGAAIEAAADEAERRLVARNPLIRYVFLDPTGGTAFRHHGPAG